MWSASRRVAAVRVCSRAALCAAVLLLGACGRDAPTTLGAATPETPPPAREAAAVAERAPPPPPREAIAAAAAIVGDDIRAVVAEIADDRYAGRAPGTAGDRLTRAYLVARLKALGFEPGIDGSYEQKIDLVGVAASPPATWRFVTGEGNIDLARSTDFVVSSGRQMPVAEVKDADVVFVGYGIDAPEYGWDDFKGVDVAGKVLVVLNNDPDWDPNLFAGTERLFYGRWVYKYENAARHGAVGAIVIHTSPSAGYPWQTVQASWGGPQFQLPAGAAPVLSLHAWVTEAAAARLLGGADKLAALVEQAKRRDFKPVSLGIKTSLTLRSAITRMPTANVVGLMRGSDPKLADQVVIFSAHHDHFGVGEPNPNGDPNDRIYNGARDNASGVGMVLAIGKAVAALSTAPARSIMLLFPAAEEQGLLGSEYFAAHPPVPAGKIAANVNYDSGNIWGATRDITFIGLGKSNLDAIAANLAAYQQRVLKADQFPDRGSYYRSDQFNFAKIGVPAFYFSGGTDFVGRPADWGAQKIDDYIEKNYHQPSDELTDDWSFDGMVEDAQFGFLAGYLVAQQPALPAWNPGNEFEAARNAAITAASPPR